MKKSFLLFLGILMFQVSLYAQPTFSEDIAPIIYNNCTGCHRVGEIGPMPFTNYSEVAAYATMIKYVTGIRYMPPWKPDPTYSNFLDERILTESEIQMIADWADNGAPEGDPSLEPDLPEFPTGSLLGEPDLVISMEEPFLHYGNNKDQYQVFVLPTDLSEDKDIAAVEFRPGNRDIAHHALMALDISGAAKNLDAQDPRYGYESFGGFGLDAEDLNFGGWVPGVTPRNFPEGIGKKLLQGSDILLQVHYGPYAVDQLDSSSINLFFSKDPVTRYLVTEMILPDILDESFLIPPDSVKEFHGVVDVPIDVSLVSIVPHMHLLGKSWEIYAIPPVGDTIPLIRIKDWDFNWQGFFSYPSLKKIPQGSKVHFYATYDNSDSNPLNPNDPPKWVSWGEGTEDEMFFAFVNFVIYQEGDEDITLSNDWEEDLLGHKSLKLYPIYPNPNEGDFTVGFQLTKPGDVEINLFDINGKLVRNLIESKSFGPGRHAEEVRLNDLSSGTYILEINANGVSQSEKVVLR